MSKRTKWMWVLGKRNIVYKGKTRPIADNWDKYVQSITSYPFRPIVLGRDSTRNTVHNEATAPDLGIVREWRVLTREQAKELGFEQRDEQALYGKVDLREDAHAISYVSPLLALNYQDEEGKRHPAIIRHLAACTVPFQQLGQPYQPDLEALAMSDIEFEGNELVPLADVDDFSLNEVQEIADALSDDVSNLQTAVDNVVSSILPDEEEDEPEESVEENKPPAPPVSASPDGEDPEKEDAGLQEADKNDTGDADGKEEVPEQEAPTPPKPPKPKNDRREQTLKATDELASITVLLRQRVARLKEAVHSMTVKPKEKDTEVSTDDIAASRIAELEEANKRLEELLFSRDVEEAVELLGIPEDIAMSARRKLEADEWQAFISRPDEGTSPKAEDRISMSKGNSLDKEVDALDEVTITRLARKRAAQEGISIAMAMDLITGGE